MRYSEVDVLVIGAGPTGQGAAKRLNQIVRPYKSLSVSCSNAELHRRMDLRG